MEDRVIFTYECHKCDAEIEKEVIFMGSTKFPVMSLSQSTWECPECGYKHFIGDIEIYGEDEL